MLSSDAFWCNTALNELTSDHISVSHADNLLHYFKLLHCPYTEIGSIKNNHIMAPQCVSERKSCMPLTKIH